MAEDGGWGAWCEGERVYWGRLRGGSWWPVQVVGEHAREKWREQVGPPRGAVEMVLYFGTKEVSWMRRDVFVAWDEGLRRGFAGKNTHRGAFVLAVKEVERAAASGEWPKGWWKTTPADTLVAAQRQIETGVARAKRFIANEESKSSDASADSGRQPRPRTPADTPATPPRQRRRTRAPQALPEHPFYVSEEAGELGFSTAKLQLSPDDLQRYHIGRDLLLGGNGMVDAAPPMRFADTIWNAIWMRERTQGFRRSSGAANFPEEEYPRPLVPVRFTSGEIIAILESPEAVQRAEREVVLWTKVRGAPFWPTQRLPDALSNKLAESRNRRVDFCVMFFGTLEHAYISQGHEGAPVTFAEGLQRGYHLKMKEGTPFYAALEALAAYLATPRRTPTSWWTLPPEDGQDDGDEAEAAEGSLEAIFAAMQSQVVLGNFDLDREDGRRVVEPDYRLLRRNEYAVVEKPKKLPGARVVVCICRKGRDNCGDECLNRASHLTCDRRFCESGDNCTNVAFERRQTVALEVRHSRVHGLGVVTLQDIPMGEFVVEYIGEVLDSAALQERIGRDTEAQVTTFYYMDLGNGLTIDARYAGNSSRYLNSSCQPNCCAQKWRDSSTGETRIGIFAMRNIAANEELTYNYNLSPVSSFRGFQCCCHAPNCRDIAIPRKVDNIFPSMLGRRIEVYFPKDDYYPGTITYVEPYGDGQLYSISYDDGDFEQIDLRDVAWRMIS